MSHHAPGSVFFIVHKEDDVYVHPDLGHWANEDHTEAFVRLPGYHYMETLIMYLRHKNILRVYLLMALYYYFYNLVLSPSSALLHIGATQSKYSLNECW